ncbi:MAG: molybdenum cofactor synthesis protein [Bacteroidales bacterium]|nr:molybdenum cofactor synthesis protein [Bacteroidales bacterium]
MKEIKILSINISTQKGTIKTPIHQAFFSKKGIQEDAHSGSWHRQVSMLAIESIRRFENILGRPINMGEFAENITTEGMELYQSKPLDKFVGCYTEFEVTQIGKHCHGDGCAIFSAVGKCVMPKEGIFVRVLREGNLKEGDTLLYIPKEFRCKVITLSDRASNGEYEDISGKVIIQMLEEFFKQKERKFKIKYELLPDDKNQLEKSIKEEIKSGTDIIITTGGTGIGKRDITIETVKPLLEKEIPGIMEYIRLKYGNEKPNALLSRSIAGVCEESFIFSLPGSTKAVKEYMTEILKSLEHMVYMLHGLDLH